MEAFADKVAAEIKPSAYKNILTEHRRDFSEFMIAQDLVRKYIQDHGCILYGGIAIDYALRLRGDKIYSDTDIPDFDFWAPNHIEVAQELTNIISARVPGSSVYATRAKFVRTMRVSVGANNWIADITYMPPRVFENLPTLTYDGMRVIHPHVQFIDVHSSLSFPYDGAPSEVVFARWTKDLERFNKLFAAYPITMENEKESFVRDMNQTAIPSSVMAHSILYGFAAYSVYSNIALLFLGEDKIGGASSAAGALPMAREPKIVRDSILVDVPRGVVDLMAHRDIAPKYFPNAMARHFRPLVDFLESMTEVALEQGEACIFSAVNRFIGYRSIAIDSSGLIKNSLSTSKELRNLVGSRIRIASIQAVLKYFMACYIRAKYLAFATHGEYARIPAETFMMYYWACLKLIELAHAPDAPRELAEFFEPSILGFGETTLPWYDTVQIHGDILRILGSDTEGSCELVLPPRNLKPSGDGAPKFDYDKCPFTIISAEEVKKT